VTPEPRRLGRSIRAVVAGLLVVVVLSLATDQLLHVLNVYPPWGQPMYDTGDNVLALSYRLVYTVLGYYVTARLAPHAPITHLWILAGIGLVLGVVGAASTIPLKLGPAWYPIAIAAAALPCAWVAAAIDRARTTI
jgi:hypothetical protein